MRYCTTKNGEVRVVILRPILQNLEFRFYVPELQRMPFERAYFHIYG